MYLHYVSAMCHTVAMGKPLPSSKNSWQELESISAKLRGIGHLIESQRLSEAPVDFEEVHWGIGLILNDLSAQIRFIWVSLDESEVAATKSRQSER